MKIAFKLLIILIVIQSCKKDEVINNCSDDIIKLECVSEEAITSVDTGFVEFEKGEQLIGLVKGIKINKEWEASLSMIRFDSLFTFGAKTFTTNDLQAETIAFLGLPITTNPGCYNMSSIQNSQDSVFTRFTLNDGDVTLANYTLDYSTENKLEIIEFDSTTLTITAKFKATFITSEAQPPYIPEKIRFFNVDMNTN